MKLHRNRNILQMIIIILCLTIYGCSISKPEQTDQEMADLTVKDNAVTITAAPAEEAPDLSSPSENEAVQSDNSYDDVDLSPTPPVIPKKSDSSKAEGNTASQDGSTPSFEPVAETVYAIVKVNVRSSSSLVTDNIVAVLDIGEAVKRTGTSSEWSEVVYQDNTCYIKTEYLSKTKPVLDIPPTDTATASENSYTTASDTSTSSGSTSTTSGDISPAPRDSSTTSGDTSASSDNEQATEEDFVASLDLASKTSKIICVIGNGGSDCTVSFHTKDENGSWHQQFSTDGDCGSKGITDHKKEGDGKTPAGIFSFSLAFGIKPDPGAKLPYRQITEYDYWIDDSDSPYYNTWVNSLEIPGNYQSEHLIDHIPQYNYVLNINYNPDNTPGLGSAIFLHGYNGSGRTTGCIAIAEKYVKTLVKEIDSSARILIVPDQSALSDY